MATWNEIMLAVKFALFYAMEFAVVTLLCAVAIGGVYQFVSSRLRRATSTGRQVEVHTSIRS